MAETTTAVVGAKHRVLLPKDARAEIDWIKPREITVCWAIPGAISGIQIISDDSEIIKQRDAFLKSSSAHARDNESHTAWFGRIRTISACWKTTIDATARLTIPAEVGVLALLDIKKGAELGIIAVGSVLEVWNKADLAAHLDKNRAWWSRGDEDDLIADRSTDGP